MGDLNECFRILGNTLNHFLTERTIRRLMLSSLYGKYEANACSWLA